MCGTRQALRGNCRCGAKIPSKRVRPDHSEFSGPFAAPAKARKLLSASTLHGKTQRTHSPTRCSRVCMHYTVHMIRFPDVALKRTGEMPAAGTACARTQIQRNSCNLPLILIPRSDRGTGFGENP